MTVGPSGVGLAPARLLDLDPDLALGLAPEAAESARQHAVVPAVAVPAGPLDIAGVTRGGLHPFAMLVTSGLLVRDVVLGQTVASELLGPGDLAALDDDQSGMLPTEVRWSAGEPASVVLLDDRLLPVMRTWPELGRALLARSTQRAVRVEAQRAISQLARVEDRLVALFGVLADRFARITASGVVISVYLTHAMLGRLVGARRPTVSLALKALADDGLIVRREDGSWLLSHDALDGLRAATGEPPVARAEARLLDLAERPAAAARPLTEAERQELTDRLSVTRSQTRALRARARISLARSAALRSRATAARGGPRRDGAPA